MKKFLMILMVIMIMVSFPLFVSYTLAEGGLVLETSTPPQLFDWGYILTSVLNFLIRILAAALLAGLGWLAERYLIPWLKEHRLMNIAVEMVLAAEAKFGRNNGMEKLNQVLDWMDDKNLHVDKETIRRTVDAAWQNLDLRMIELGLKLPPHDHPPDDSTK